MNGELISQLFQRIIIIDHIASDVRTEQWPNLQLTVAVAINTVE